MPKKPIKFLFVGRTATGKSSIAEAVSNKTVSYTHLLENQFYL